MDVDATPSRGSLSGSQIRGAYKASSTHKTYASCIRGITQWIRAKQSSPDQVFEQDGTLDITVFTPAHFEAFLLDIMNGTTLKVTTFSGYRSAIKDVY